MSPISGLRFFYFYLNRKIKISSEMMSFMAQMCVKMKGNEISNKKYILIFLNMSFCHL